MKNNTLNIDGLNQLLDTLMIENFNNLTDTQSKMIGIRRFKMNISDFRKTNVVPNSVGEKRYHPSRYINYVEFSFIPTSKRRLYRNSKYFNQYIDYNDISENPQIFTHNYMIFIDGKLIRTTEIHADEHRLGIIIDVKSPNNVDGISIESYLDYVKRDVDVELVLVPNYTVSMVITNRAALTQRSFTIPNERLTNIDKVTDKSMLFMSDDVDNNTSLVMVPYERNDVGIVVDIDPKLVPKNVIFLMIHPTKMSDTFIITGDNPYFQLDKNMPVPIDQIQIFKRVYHRGWFMVDGELSIDSYYPNIYKVNGLLELDQVIVQVYYTDIDDDKYYNDLALFYKYSTNIMDMYSNQTIPDIIKNYKPCPLEYGIEDCNKLNMPTDIIGYKLDKIKYLIDNDSMYLNNYIIASLEKANNYLVKCESIDMSTRVRNNPSKELHSPSYEEFNEPHYVFGFNYHVLDVAKNTVKLFIDGLYIHENNYLFYGTDLGSFIYIPCRMLKSNSVIEIERYWDYIFNTEVIPLSNNHLIPISINNPDCRIKNIFLTDSDEYYIPSDSYEIYMDGELYPNTSNVKISGNISIKVLNELYHNIPIRVMMMNDCDADIYKHDTDVISQVSNTESLSCNRSSNYRVFKNGLLLPEQAFEVYTVDRRRRRVSIIVKTMNKRNDEIVVDYAPCDYKVKYTQDYIKDPKGYVSIPYGAIDKPISLRWFDIYLNGIKLNKTNIEIISPTKFYVKNVRSRKNLVIIERDRDNELVSMGPDNSDSINDAIINIPGFKDKVDETLDDIHDILPDIIGDLIDDIIIDIIRFIELCLKYTFIKPDIEQLTNEIIDEYSSFLSHGNEFMLNGNPKDNEPPVTIRIDCNDIAPAPNDVGDKTQEEVGGMAERFAVGPLSTENVALAINGEMLLNPSSGDCAICTPSGVISSTRNARLNSMIEKLKRACVRDGIVTGSIAMLEPDTVSYPQRVESSVNLLDEDLYIENNKTMFYIDVDVLTPDNKTLTTAGDVVFVTMTYFDCGNEKIVEVTLDEFNNMTHIITPGSNIQSISLSEPTGNTVLVYLVHSILMTL